MSDTSRKRMAWDGAFWAGKRVLLTGHTGFKGAWLAAWLTRLGAQVTGLSLPAALGESQAWRSFGGALVAQGLADRRGDINGPELTEAVAASDPQIVLHLAAQAIVLDSYAAPVETWETNVMGTLRVLQALGARRAPCSFVGVTSDKCYENKGWPWGYREIDPLGGHDPYSASKGACEILLASWRASFSEATGVHVASGRAGNVIGGGDDAAHRIMPDLMRAFSEGEPAFIRNPSATRPYQHVLEPLSGYLLLARFLHEEPARYAQAYNFGPAAGGEIRNDELARIAADAWDGPVQIRLNKESTTSSEAQFLMLDSSKARRDLGWHPAWDVRQAVQATVAWHRETHRGTVPSFDLAQQQIASYESTAA